MIKGGCFTQTAATYEPHAATFSLGGTERVVLTITPEGKLVTANWLSSEESTREVAAMLVQEFGRAYGSALRAAEETARGCEAKVGRLERQNAELRRENDRREQDIKRLEGIGKVLRQQINELEGKSGSAGKG